MKAKPLSKEQPLPLDIISILPQNIIENILCLVPIKEAVRTSILAKEWRYIWTKIPKIVFDEYEMVKRSTDKNQLSVSEQTDDVASERKNMWRRCKVFYAIYQFLLLHQGPVHEFSLFLGVDETCVEIDQIITYLSRNNTSFLKKLTLNLSQHKRQYKLPFSVFSLHQLTDLSLCECYLDFQPTLYGFRSLTTLHLQDVHISTKTLVRLMSGSPLLKRLTLLIERCDIIENDNSTIIELFECLSSIENLTIWISIIEFFVLDSVPQKLPTSLIRLKDIHFEGVCFFERYWLPILAILIKCSPNLEKIKLEILPADVEDEIDSNIIEKYFSNICLEHLSEFEIENFSILKSELDFVMFILAKSPKLKKVRIMLDNKDEEAKMLRILLGSPHASPAVEIIVDH